jgi:hypothetical protein
MNPVETRTRILRHLAVCRYQIEALNRNGQSISAYSEAAVQEALNAVHDWQLRNLNSTANNTPAVDLLSSDGTIGVQATFHVTKAKYEKTVSALKDELQKPRTPLAKITRLHIVGLTAVKNKAISTWARIDGTGIEAKAYSLTKDLDLSNLKENTLATLDVEVQKLASTRGMLLRSDEEELAVIVRRLDRKAISDSYDMELSWQHMHTAMQDIRRLLSQGADNASHVITRPYDTFQPKYSVGLKSIYDTTALISRILGPGLTSRSVLSNADGVLIDGFRRKIIETITDLCSVAQIQPPTWAGSSVMSKVCNACHQPIP